MTAVFPLYTHLGMHGTASCEQHILTSLCNIVMWLWLLHVDISPSSHLSSSV